MFVDRTCFSVLMLLIVFVVLNFAEPTISNVTGPHVVCSEPCINGVCQGMEYCACDYGYKRDGKDKYKCVPICYKDCGHGFCIAPKKCSCDTGYTFHTRRKTCIPDCGEGCVHNTCIAPGNCTCFIGYRKQEYGCKPYCSSGCLHGTCVSPETCACDEGWQEIVTNGTTNKICQPICTKPCINSKCVAPDTCECLPGYAKSNNNTSNSDSCEPRCYSGCPHGSCVSPETCACDEGWKRTEIDTTAPDICECLPGYEESDSAANASCNDYCRLSGCLDGSCVSPNLTLSMNGPTKFETCQPICDPLCTNGTCVAPNTCECYPGYKLVDEYTCIPHCSGDCSHGSCVGPEICVCDLGWSKTNKSRICVANETSGNTMKLVKQWFGLNWMYVMAATLLIIAAAVALYIKFVTCRKCANEDITVPVPAEKIRLNFIKKTKPPK